MVVATVALVVGAAACSSSGSSESTDTAVVGTNSATTTIVAATTTQPATTTTLSLEQTIANDWQGTRLDVIGSGEPAPGGTTVMFFLNGDIGAEVYWKSADEWCALSTFNWKVTNATSETAFSLDFQEIEHFDSCLFVPGEGPHFVWTPTGSRTVDGRTVYDGNYSVPAQYDSTRTVCSSDWADAAPCGFADAAAALPPLPGN